MVTEQWLIDGHHYEVDTANRLGKGSYGFVCRATTESGDPVAIKLIPDAAHIAGLDRELDNVRGLVGRSFANIVIVHAASVEGDHGYIVMELATGTLQQCTPMSEDSALDAIGEIAGGLQQLHQLGIIHRDLKPANVLDTSAGFKITDFGFGRLIENSTATATFREFGTPLYMAPEQWTGERSSIQTDLYALGCIGYELLTGQPPFMATNREDLRDHHLNDAPTPLTSCADERTATLVHRLLNKQQADRPQDTREVLERLDAIRTSGQQNTAALATVAALHQRQVEVERLAETAAQQALSRRHAIEQQGKNALSDIIDDFIAEAKTTLTNLVKLPNSTGVKADGFALHTKVGVPHFSGTIDENGHIVYAGSVSIDVGQVHHPDVMNLAYIHEDDRYSWRAYQLSHHAGPSPRHSHMLEVEQGPPKGVNRNDWITEIEHGLGPYVTKPFEACYLTHSSLFTAQRIHEAIEQATSNSRPTP